MKLLLIPTRNHNLPFLERKKDVCLVQNNLKKKTNLHGEVKKQLLSGVSDKERKKNLIFVAESIAPELSV